MKKELIGVITDIGAIESLSGRLRYSMLVDNQWVCAYGDVAEKCTDLVIGCMIKLSGTEKPDPLGTLQGGNGVIFVADGVENLSIYRCFLCGYPLVKTSSNLLYVCKACYAHFLAHEDSHCRQCMSLVAKTDKPKETGENYDI
jgi:ribosomal protein L40E